MKVYLDYAAATPLDPRVLEVMQPYLADAYANPSAVYAAARVTREAVEAARKSIADTIGAKPTEIVFTSGGTEGNNLAIQGVLNTHPGAGWITTAIEHDAVLAIGSLPQLAEHQQTVLPVTANGLIDIEPIVYAITDDTVLISVALANNEIGTIQPIAKLAQAIELIRSERVKRGATMPLYLHTDACQAAGYLDLHVTRLGVDLMTVNGSKLYGPKGTGFLYVRTGTVLTPLFGGGGQERGRRSGTENVAGVVGLAEALRLAAATREVEARRLTELRDDLTARILDSVTQSSLNGDSKRRLPNNVNVTVHGAEGEALVLYLDNAGFSVATGSACSSGDLDPSHVLLAIGRTRDEAAQSLRITLGRQTTATDIERLTEVLPGVVARVRELS